MCLFHTSGDGLTPRQPSRPSETWPLYGRDGERLGQPMPLWWRMINAVILWARR